MSEKTRERVKATGEVFTPRELIHEMLQKIPSNAWLPGKRWLEPSAGDGNFLYEVKYRVPIPSDGFQIFSSTASQVTCLTC